jgi:hypothetical protein
MELKQVWNQIICAFEMAAPDGRGFLRGRAVKLGSWSLFQAQIYGQELLFLGIGGKFGEFGLVSCAKLRTRIASFQIRR